MTKTASCARGEAFFLFTRKDTTAVSIIRGPSKAERSNAATLLTPLMSKVMRLLGIFLFAASLTVSANVYSQNVTLTANNLPLKSLFSMVEKETGYVFFYNKQLLENTKPVTLSVVNMPLETFLLRAFKDQPLNFRIEGRPLPCRGSPWQSRKIRINLSRRQIPCAR